MFSYSISPNLCLIHLSSASLWGVGAESKNESSCSFEVIDFYDKIHWNGEESVCLSLVDVWMFMKDPLTGLYS